MKRAVFICVVFISALCTAMAAEPVEASAGTAAITSVAALRQRLAAMPRGDTGRGRQLYTQQFCASCHGVDGRAPTVNWPSVAGQRIEYGYKLLQDYRQGLRHEGERAAVMRDAVQGLSDRDLSDLATYTAQLVPAQRSTAGRIAGTEVQNASVEQLVRYGHPTRLLTACASCHGARGEGGNRAQPALAGQNPAYLVRTLLDYQSGARANDPARGMRHFAAKLSRAEIDALAVYYAKLPGSARPGSASAVPAH